MLVSRSLVSIKQLEQWSSEFTNDVQKDIGYAKKVSLMLIVINFVRKEKSEVLERMITFSGRTCHLESKKANT